MLKMSCLLQGMDVSHLGRLEITERNDTPDSGLLSMVEQQQKQRYNSTSSSINSRNGLVGSCSNAYKNKMLNDRDDALTNLITSLANASIANTNNHAYHQVTIILPFISSFNPYLALFNCTFQGGRSVINI